MPGFFWTCPTCGHHTTVTPPNYAMESMDLKAQATPAGQSIKVRSMLIECPNQKCKAQYFDVKVNRSQERDGAQRRFDVDEKRPVGIGKFVFLPTTAQPLSLHVSAGVLEDYNEAYLIRTLSPKAAATLARRALQGMIRDFWKEVRPTLNGELLAIKDKCDPALYEAMMGITSVGNIGAHPEQDTSLIVEIEPGEAEALLDLLHVLDQEWYQARADRDARIAKVKALSAEKKAERSSAASPTPPGP